MPLLDDTGFVPDPWTRLADDRPAPEGARVIVSLARLREQGPPAGAAALGVHVAPEDDPEAVAEAAARAALISVGFSSFADGRGFSVARRLRAAGFAGELRAFGPLIADQFAALRACGFDAVEIPEALAARQDEAQWLAAARSMTLGYQRGYALPGRNILEARRAAREEAAR
ncbi:DUF934 domain-containing protein [Oceanicella actignis]|uniref:Uncharacterized conserved protein, DUF934 family n=1 Tax=Oceanicella actignis TaxID=1189325 RepID=A0A1M7TUF1_9RHOB|nr:DUF934 domain-containing protein [Oceanicella actignis]TYO90510.1 uncharacterized protein (DUF934 family) [Oceanicella actignis]SES78309.1 Uncharacterized conserved protein, DUF934 family [Oceanicella actignis]SHN74286.1 Uncharacterized conserved protein, DUF934 family [Oceanicella actignis]